MTKTLDALVRDIRIEQASHTCLRLLADQVPLSLLIDLALPTALATYEDVRDENGDTSWLSA
jgi:hypothetical protein